MHIMPSNHRKVIILLAPLAALCLSACGNSSVEAIKPPPEKLTCAGEPPVPEGAITDAVVGDYMVAQRAAWFDCHSKIDWLRNFRSEEHTSELQSLMRISYAVFCLKKTKTRQQ